MIYAAIEGGVVIVKVKGTFNQKVTLEVEKETNEFLNMGEKNFLFDFKETDYMDSTGLGYFIELREKLDDKDGTLILRGLFGYCLELFRMSQLDDEFVLQNEEM